MFVEKYTLPVWFVPVESPPRIGMMSSPAMRMAATVSATVRPDGRDDISLSWLRGRGDSLLRLVRRDITALMAPLYMITAMATTISAATAICHAVALAMASAGDVLRYSSGVLSSGNPQYL